MFGVRRSPVETALAGAALLFFVVLCALTSVTLASAAADCPAEPTCECVQIFSFLFGNRHVLNCSSRALETVPAFSMDFKITELWLDGNALTEIPDNSFWNLATLAKVDVSNNRLTSVTQNLFSHQSVYSLSLANNDIKELPALSEENLKIVQLDVSGNPLGTLKKEWFQAIVNMSSLTAQRIQLKELAPDVFSSNVKLWYLQLSYNELATFPAQIIQDLPSLSTLRITNNVLQDFPSEPLQGRNFTLDLQKNKLRCEVTDRVKAALGEASSFSYDCSSTNTWWSGSGNVAAPMTTGGHFSILFILSALFSLAQL